MLALPPEDRQRSPHTGWTRAHWEAAADGLLAAVRRHASPRHALLLPPGGRPSLWGERSDGLEGYARTFLLAAFRLAGAKGEAPGDLASGYADGLAAGTEPGGAEAWPAIADYSQPLVEAASIAIGLYETRPWIWDRLPPAVRERAADWLRGALRCEAWPTNWLLFQVIVAAFLESVGAPSDAALMERNLDRIDAMYRCDGWYTDGDGENFDYYAGWAIHLYTILWGRMGGERRDPERAGVHRARLRRFLEDHRCLFAANGAPLHHGRSLIYRFAATAPLWAGALAGCSPLPPGETRRLASGAVRHFLDRGALRDGVLTMGWHHEFLPMAQSYSGPASPYWASKGFLGLLLPPDDPVWTAAEEPAEVERGDFCRAMPGPGFLVWGRRDDGIVCAASHRSDHFPMAGAVGGDPHYRKLSYSSHTGPEIAAAGGDGDADAMVALLDERGGATSRARFHFVGATDRFAASVIYPGEQRVLGEQSFPVWFERLETVSVVCAAGEVRIHHVLTPWPRRLRDGGLAVAAAEPPSVALGDRWALARTADGLTSLSVALAGFDSAAVALGEGRNAFGRHSAAPVLSTSTPATVERVLVALHVLTRAPVEVAAALGAVEDLRLDGRIVRFACAGEHFLVQLVEADALALSLGPHQLSGRVRFARASADGELFRA